MPKYSASTGKLDINVTIHLSLRSKRSLSFLTAKMREGAKKREDLGLFDLDSRMLSVFKGLLNLRASSLLRASSRSKKERDREILRAIC